MPTIDQETEVHFGRKFHGYSLREGANFLPVDQITNVDVYTDNFDDDVQDDLDEEEESGSNNLDPDISLTGDAVRDDHLMTDRVDPTTESPDGRIPAKITWKTTLFNKAHSTVPEGMLWRCISHRRWRPLLRELRGLLIRGGWIQIIEANFGNIQSRTGRLIGDDARNAKGLQDWIEMYRTGMNMLGRDGSFVEHAASILDSVGYVDISRTIHRWHIGAWQADRDITLKEQTFDLVVQSLASLGLWLACGVQHMSKDDFDNLLRRAVADLRRADVQAYIEWSVIIARRPPKGYTRQAPFEAKESVGQGDDDIRDGFMKPISPVVALKKRPF
ncbi:hypothetical protein BDZ85DRAFT_279840 [Elsinoe ampelina]|uniref:Uncharacterized protein n=1 Tax=Elsinoe ampelina TaxID=302913 RepID=A0A6A6GLG2_9PEZI|nr:hypothetical protein BDZ85DRAFT_279840 [Elsinoe ampelina]